MSFLKNFFKGDHYKISLREDDKISNYILPYISVETLINLVDIGAHTGGFTDDIAKHYTIANAILAEPIPSLAKELTSKYLSKGYYVYQNAFADKDGEQIDFYINEFAQTSSLLKIQTQMEELSDVKSQLVEKVAVTKRTLDSVIKEKNFTIIDLLKIDVQGSEHLVIEGAKKALLQTRYVWIELSFKPLYDGSALYFEIITLMQEFGFILLELSPGHRSQKHELLQVDALFANSKIV